MAAKTPRFADKLLAFFLKGDLLEEVMGDLHEFHRELDDLPAWKRIPLYWFQALHFIRPNLIKSLFGSYHLNNIGMIKLHFKLATRSLFKQPSTTIPSLLTLIFGVLCFQLIYSWFDNELSMDNFHNNYNRIYVGAVQTNPMAERSALSPSLLFRLDYDQFPEIEDKLLIHVYGSDEIAVEADGREFGGKGLVADSSFFSFFDFPIKLGDEENLLHDPSHIVLSGNFANRLFRDKNPIGKMLKVNCDQEGLYKVVAVTERIPANSSIGFDFIIPRHSQRFWRRIPMDLILAASDFNVADLNKKVTKTGREMNERFPESILSFHPIQSLYFDHPMEVGLLTKTGDRKTVRTFVFIAFVICLITFLGFNSLQSTRQLASAHKMGIKQMVGGTRASLCLEMITERGMYLMITTLVTFMFFQGIFPFYRSGLGLELSPLPFQTFLGIFVVTSGIILASVLISIIQIYSINVKEAVFGTLSLFRIPRLQRAIVVVQYAVTIVLLIATTVVVRQYMYMSQKEPGFAHQEIVSIDFFEISNDTSQARSVQYVKDQLAFNPKVLAFSQGDLPVNGDPFLSSWKRLGTSYEYESKKVMIVDPGYVELLGIDMLEGRFFRDSLDQPGQPKVVINEAAKKYWDIQDYSKAKLSSNTSGREEMDFEIVGVVQDFHFEHLSQKIEPLILRYRPYPDDAFLVRFEEGTWQEGIVFLEELFNQVNPNQSFNYELLEDRVTRQYEHEKRQGKIYSAFTMVALILSSISLFTFSLYEVKRRTKELGIRKVNGASARSIFGLLSRDFLKSVAIAFVIAIPFAWYLSHEWIQSFAYRIPVGWVMFVGAGLLVALLALLATLWNVMSVARQNPVEVLRYE